MGEIIAVHSFRGGTGKSNLTANFAYLAVEQGKRVAIVDCDILSPGIHILYQLDPRKIEHTLNDYLEKKCPLEEAISEIIPEKLYLIPSSLQAGEIARILREGYDAERLVMGLEEIMETYALDYLFIDTHPGLNEETLLAMSIADRLLIVLRPDQQDYQGTAITVEVAKKLEIPQMFLLINKNPSSFDEGELKKRIEKSYGIPVKGILPFSEDLLILGSGDLFVKKYPDHPLTNSFRAIFKEIVK